MMAKENILKPASGQPVIGHNREMALGIYYATSVDETIMPIEDRVFIPDEAVLAFQIGKIKLRQQIKVHLKGEVTETVVGRILLNPPIMEGD